jgi:penicillin V acylase-like amidase (Ntn superfamily)
MKKKIYIFTIVLILFIANIPNVISCTVFHASDDNYAFGGNNEDYNDPDTYIYFIPPTEIEYGRAIVGYSGNYWIQGGINEHGLFWDGLAAPYLEVLNSNGKPYFNGHIFDYILSVCDTCDEAIDILDQYNMKILERAQILMGDKYGDSFIIEGDIIHRKSDYFQLSTNFYLSQYPNPPYLLIFVHQYLMLFIRKVLILPNILMYMI